MDDIINRLGGSASLYLRQHKDNPVAWQPWGEEAFALATRLGRPVLLSSGYASCHWCHVMAHESFDDSATAALINQHFVAIKLDREERPDIDALYQQALGLMGKQGGWPLTMFLTPDGKPFWGGTYFPRLPRHGLPAFGDVLAGISGSYKNERDKIDFNAKTIEEHLKHRSPQAPLPSANTIKRVAQYFLSNHDSVHGGLGSAPKFPQLTALRLMWDVGLCADDKHLQTAVFDSLVAMCHGGLYDHIGGGFFRYCVDAHWQEPHFEKMLDDQSLFIALLADVLSWRDQPLLRQALDDTVAFVLRELQDSESSLFYTALDADDANGEGAFYLWRNTQVKTELGPQADLFCAIYSLESQDPALPQRSNALTPTDAEGDILRLCRKKLLYKRQQRDAPAIDTLITAAGNAQLCVALKAAGHHEAADKLYGAICAYFFTPAGVRRSAHLPALLIDYAALAQAALVMNDKPRAENLLAGIKAAFDCTDGLYSAAPRGQMEGFYSAPPLLDGPAPSAHALLLEVMTRLGDAGVEPLARALSGEAAQAPAGMAACLNALWFYQNPLEISGIDKPPRYLPGSVLKEGADKIIACVGTRCLAPLGTGEGLDDYLNAALRARLYQAAND